MIRKLSLVHFLLIPLILMTAFNNCGTPKFETNQPSSLEILNSTGMILINDGAPYTKIGDVVLSIANKNAKEMYVTNDSTCKTGGTWEPLANSRSWKLSELNKETAVYVKFRESPGDVVQSLCINDSIMHDNIAPQVTIQQSVDAYINGSDAIIKFSASDAGSGIGKVVCKDDGKESASCETVHSRTGLAEGNHSVEVVAYDRAENASLPKTVAFMVDKTAPVLTLNSAPSLISNQLTAIFEVSAVDALSGISHYECKYTSTWEKCASKFSRTYGEGAQSISIRAVDKAGNLSNQIDHAWYIDASAPTVILTQTPGPNTNQTNAVFSFEGTDKGQPITKFECSLDSGTAVSCSSPHSLASLAEGVHKFSVVGIDSAGNRSQPASYTWRVDVQPPTVKLVQTPPKYSSSQNATFTFTAQDTGSGIDRSECQLDGAGFKPCSGSASYTGLGDISHQFEVRAYDKAGNVSETVTYTWQIDITKPTVTITSGPAEYVNSTTVELTFTGQDIGVGLARFECRINNGSYQACTSPAKYTVTSEGAYVFSVRAVDLAGNLSDVKTHSWTVDRTGPTINIEKMPLAVTWYYDPSTVQYSVVASGAALAQVTCGLDGQLIACAAANSVTYTGLSVGDHKFTVIAQDAIGNESRKDVLWKITDQSITKTQTVVQSGNKKIDVLVVIDNSGSMAFEQQNMAARFSSFIDVLNGFDWQVGIITTDVESDAAKKDGRFLELGTMPGEFILKSSMDLALAKSAFGATIQRPQSEGSGYEQGVAATVRAVQRSQQPSVAVNAPNVNFFRSDAALATIVVTDADETNRNGTQDINKPETLFNLLKATWATKTFSFNSIIVKPGDSACVGINGNEGYGYTYEAASKLTGGIIGSVCESDYGSQLTNLGQKTLELTRSATLDCQPLDGNGDGKPDITVVTADGSAAPAYVIQGTKITFDSDLPFGTNTISYLCLKP